MDTKRSFELSGKSQLIVLTLLALLLTVGVFRVLAAPAEIPADAPLAALYAVTWNSASITQTTTSAAHLTQNYAYHDVACSVDIGDTQRLTVTLESSLDNVNWFQIYEFSAITADTTVTTGIFSRTLSYGRYERMALTLSTANPITPTCKSVFFNNWMPGNEVAPMER